jgi:hypothetical protein
VVGRDGASLRLELPFADKGELQPQEGRDRAGRARRAAQAHDDDARPRSGYRPAGASSRTSLGSPSMPPPRMNPRRWRLARAPQATQRAARRARRGRRARAAAERPRHAGWTSPAAPTRQHRARALVGCSAAARRPAARPARASSPTPPPAARLRPRRARLVDRRMEAEASAGAARAEADAGVQDIPIT